jgi:hypothetical protein
MTLEQRNHYVKHMVAGTNPRVRYFENLKGHAIADPSDSSA